MRRIIRAAHYLTNCVYGPTLRHFPDFAAWQRVATTYYDILCRNDTALFPAQAKIRKPSIKKRSLGKRLVQYVPTHYHPLRLHWSGASFFTLWPLATIATKTTNCMWLLPHEKENKKSSNITKSYIIITYMHAMINKSIPSTMIAFFGLFNLSSESYSA